MRIGRGKLSQWSKIVTVIPVILSGGGRPRGYGPLVPRENVSKTSCWPSPASRPCCRTPWAAPGQDRRARWPPIVRVQMKAQSLPPWPNKMPRHGEGLPPAILARARRPQQRRPARGARGRLKKGPRHQLPTRRSSLRRRNHVIRDVHKFAQQAADVGRFHWLKRTS